MTPESVVTIGQNAIYITVLIISLLLLPALGVGLLISMFQAATQINEQTLSFIPKLLVM
ncbi:MAG TPA: EscS/YscS/HrcS family type III secretion system export apparatus protein, partial [Chromatiales bacterium]|nr:EscS/YscS/HrcS family type III secretion system export apparatus protein [Chromatiales bacterium]